VSHANTFTIDDELRSLLPSPTAEELANLEASLRAEGCRDALIVWQEQKILVDGHTRYFLCQQFCLPYRTVAKSFPDRAAVIAWMVKEQLGRRNVTEEQKSYLRGMLYLEAKKHVGGQEGNKNASNDGSESLSDSFSDTASQLAQEHGVSDRTIRNDAAFAQAVDAAVEVAGEDVRPVLLGGKASRQEIRLLSEKEKEEATLKIEEIKSRKQKERRKKPTQKLRVLALPAAETADGDAPPKKRAPRTWPTLMRVNAGTLRELATALSFLRRVPLEGRDPADARDVAARIRAVADALESGVAEINNSQGVG
jgi:hypothetical protein